ncbi:hypothetical protein ACIPV9_01880 [Pseudomonas psychrophila]|uniref:hypothetical protein n=1 Tax=Pseudomonas psychrophila TaxID=122355 RepID=UPI003800E450
MAWTFKDRYNPTRQITIDDEIPLLLKRLGETFQDFRYHNSLSTLEQKELILKKGATFAKIIYIHTQVSYCLGTHDCQKDFHYQHYCKVVKKNLINVHPMFALKKYAEYISLIRNDNEISKKNLLKTDFNSLNDNE